MRKNNGLTICVDFDGTCTTHGYPKVGRNIGAQKVLNRLVDNGHQLILYTMRSGGELQDAVKWFEENGIPLYGVQENPTQKQWTTSPKCYAQLYIDDAALGTPLVYSEGERPYVNWVEVERLLFEAALI